MQYNFSIVVPFYNEEENITLFFDELIKVIFNINNSYNFEIVCINDGSKDNTNTFLNEYKKKYNFIRVFNFLKNKGQSNAIYYGIQNAKYENIITIDGDCQNDPRDIKKMIDLFQKNSSIFLLAGERKKRIDSVVKIISSRIANKFRDFIFKDGCKDTGCSLKIFKKNIFLQIPFFDGIHRFIPSLFVGFGYNVRYINVNHRPRQKGHSNYGISNRLFKGLKDIFVVKKIIQKHIK